MNQKVYHKRIEEETKAATPVNRALHHEQSKEQLHPDFAKMLSQYEVKELQDIINERHNMLPIPTQNFKRQATIRSCATGRQAKNITELTSRLKTEGNIS